MWKITRNIIDADEPNPVKPVSHNFNGPAFDLFPTRKFRLLDDDGEVYFEGLITEAALNGPEEESFAPLDDFGRGYGCTELQYREGGKWVTL